MSLDGLFQYGDIVWVRVEDIWYPGEVAQEHPELRDPLTPRPYCIVRFFTEPEYVYVTAKHNIFPFHCFRGMEFIKIGSQLTHTNRMRNFPTDLAIARYYTQRPTNTGEDSLEITRLDSIIRVVYVQPAAVGKHDVFDERYGSQPARNVTTTDNIIKHLNIFNNESDASTSEGESRGASRRSDRLRSRVYSTAAPRTPASSQRSTNARAPASPPDEDNKFYRCSLCSYSCQRINVLILHFRTHRENLCDREKPFPPKRISKPSCKIRPFVNERWRIAPIRGYTLRHHIDIKSCEMSGIYEGIPIGRPQRPIRQPRPPMALPPLPRREMPTYLLRKCELASLTAYARMHQARLEPKQVLEHDCTTEFYIDDKKVWLYENEIRLLVKLRNKWTKKWQRSRTGYNFLGTPLADRILGPSLRYIDDTGPSTSAHAQRMADYGSSPHSRTRHHCADHGGDGACGATGNDDLKTTRAVRSDKDAVIRRQPVEPNSSVSAEQDKRDITPMEALLSSEVVVQLSSDPAATRKYSAADERRVIATQKSEPITPKSEQPTTRTRSGRGAPSAGPGVILKGSTGGVTPKASTAAIPKASAGKGLSKASTGGGTPKASIGKGAPKAGTAGATPKASTGVTQKAITEDIPKANAGGVAPMASIGKGSLRASTGGTIPKASKGVAIPKASTDVGAPIASTAGALPKASAAGGPPRASTVAMRKRTATGEPKTQATSSSSCAVDTHIKETTPPVHQPVAIDPSRLNASELCERLRAEWSEEEVDDDVICIAASHSPASSTASVRWSEAALNPVTSDLQPVSSTSTSWQPTISRSAASTVSTSQPQTTSTSLRRPHLATTPARTMQTRGSARPSVAPAKIARLEDRPAKAGATKAAPAQATPARVTSGAGAPLADEIIDVDSSSPPDEAPSCSSATTSNRGIRNIPKKDRRDVVRKEFSRSNLSSSSSGSDVLIESFGHFVPVPARVNPDRVNPTQGSDQNQRGRVDPAQSIPVSRVQRRRTDIDQSSQVAPVEPRRADVNQPSQASLGQSRRINRAQSSHVRLAEPRQTDQYPPSRGSLDQSGLGQPSHVGLVQVPPGYNHRSPYGTANSPYYSYSAQPYSPHHASANQIHPYHGYADRETIFPVQRSRQEVLSAQRNREGVPMRRRRRTMSGDRRRRHKLLQRPPAYGEPIVMFWPGEIPDDPENELPSSPVILNEIPLEVDGDYPPEAATNRSVAILNAPEVSASIETLNATVEVVNSPVEVVSEPVEAVNAPIETIQTPEETIKAPEETVKAPEKPRKESEIENVPTVTRPSAAEAAASVAPSANEEPSTGTPAPAESQAPAPTTASCFDFQEEDNAEDVLTSIASFKKKYLSPDKSQSASGEDNAEQPTTSSNAQRKAKQEELKKKDQQLSPETANSSQQPAVVVISSSSGSSREEISVKDLPTKERRKRFFTNRSRDKEDLAAKPTLKNNESIVVIEAQGTSQGPKSADNSKNSIPEKQRSHESIEEPTIVEKLVLPTTSASAAISQSEVRSQNVEEKTEGESVNEQPKTVEEVPVKQSAEGILEESTQVTAEQTVEAVEVAAKQPLEDSVQESLKDTVEDAEKKPQEDTVQDSSKVTDEVVANQSLEDTVEEQPEDIAKMPTEDTTKETEKDTDMHYAVSTGKSSEEGTTQQTEEQSSEVQEEQPETTTAMVPECTPKLSEKDTPVHTEEGTPVHTEEDTPVHTEDTPMHPEVDTIVHPEEATPVHTEEGTLLHPEEDTLVRPKEDTPVHPEEDTPGHPEEDTPGHKEEDTPVHPEEDTPVHPEEDTLVHPKEDTTVHPEDHKMHPEGDTAMHPEDDHSMHPEEDHPMHTEEDTPKQSEQNTEVQIEQQTVPQVVMLREGEVGDVSEQRIMLREEEVEAAVAQFVMLHEGEVTEAVTQCIMLREGEVSEAVEQPLTLPQGEVGEAAMQLIVEAAMQSLQIPIGTSVDETSRQPVEGYSAQGEIPSVSGYKNSMESEQRPLTAEELQRQLGDVSPIPILSFEDLQSPTDFQNDNNPPPNMSKSLDDRPTVSTIVLPEMKSKPDTEETQNGLKELAVDVNNAPVDDKSPFTSPTDDNSSACVSETCAEFGSPTSMLDEERRQLISTERTEDECKPKKSDNINENHIEDFENLDEVQSKVDNRITKENETMIETDVKSTKVDNVLSEEIKEEGAEEEEDDDIESPPHEELSGNELDAEPEREMRKRRSSPRQHVVKQKARITPPSRKQQKPQAKPERCTEALVIEEVPVVREMTPDKPRTRRTKTNSNSSEQNNRATHEAEIAAETKSEANVVKRVTRAARHQQQNEHSKDHPTEPEPVVKELPIRDSLKVQERGSRESPRRSTRNLKSPNVEETLQVQNVQTEVAQQAETVTKGANGLASAKANEHKLAHPVAKKDEEADNAANKDDKLAHTEVAANVVVASESSPTESAEQMPQQRKRRSHMKITPRRPVPTVENQIQAGTTTPTSESEKANMSQSENHGDRHDVPEPKIKTLEETVIVEKSKEQTLPPEVALELLHSEESETPTATKQSEEKAATCSSEEQVIEKVEELHKEISGDQKAYNVTVHEMHVDCNLEAAKMPVNGKPIALDAHKAADTLTIETSEVSTDTPAVSPSSVSEIRSFRPRRKTNAHELAPSEIEASAETAEMEEAPQVEETNTKNQVQDAAPLEETISEKVLINVDVTNPLSTQIASIPTSDNGQKPPQRPQLPTKKRQHAQHRVGSGASNTLKRKKSLEDDIPSFIIERPVAAADTAATEKELLPRVHTKRPQTKITRKEKSTEAKAVEPAKPSTTTTMNADEAASTTATATATAPPSQLAANNAEPVIERVETDTATMFDINSLPILLSGDQMHENMQILITPSSSGGIETAQAILINPTTVANNNETPRILQQQILQPALPPLQQRQRKTSTHQQPPAAQSCNKQLGVDSRGKKYVIIKTPPADLIVQQPALQHLQSATITKTAKPQAGTFSSGVIKERRPSEVSQPPPPQQPPSTAKPKSPAAAATGGRKHAGNTITLPSSAAVKQQQQKLNESLAAAAAKNARKRTLSPGAGVRRAPSCTTTLQQPQMMLPQRRQTVTAEQLTEGGFSTAELINLQRRLSFSEASGSSAKVPRTSLASADVTFTTYKQLQQLQRQQQKLLERRNSLSMGAQTAASTSGGAVSIPMPPLHHLHNRKPRRQPQQHRGNGNVRTTATTTTQRAPLEQHQQPAQTQVSEMQQIQQLPIQIPTVQQQQQQQQLPPPLHMQAPVQQLVHSTTRGQEQLMHMQNDIEDNNILAVPTRPIPGYNETFLLCTIENGNYKAFNNEPLYLDRETNQLVPVPLDALTNNDNIEIPEQQMEEVISMQTIEPDSSSQLIGLEPQPVENISDNNIIQEEVETVMEEVDNAATAQLILFVGGHQIVIDSRTLENMSANPDVNAAIVSEDGSEYLLTRDVIEALQRHQLAQQQQQQLALESGMPTDILAVALADSDLGGNEVLQIETSPLMVNEDPSTSNIGVFQPPALPPAHLTPPITAHTSETNALLNQTPIMSTLENPSNAAAVMGNGARHCVNLAGNVLSNVSQLLGVAGDGASPMSRPTLDDSLAVIGVTAQSSAVPTSLELPITVTNPAIAPKVTMAAAAAAAAHNELMQFQASSNRVTTSVINSDMTHIYNDPGS